MLTARAAFLEILGNNLSLAEQHLQGRSRCTPLFTFVRLTGWLPRQDILRSRFFLGLLHSLACTLVHRMSHVSIQHLNPAARRENSQGGHSSLCFFRITHPDRCMIAIQNPTQTIGKRIMLAHLPTT